MSELEHTEAVEELPPAEELFDETNLKTDYMMILKESNKLVKKLIEDAEQLQLQLTQERKRNADLEKRLLLYYETGVSNINRFTFRNHMIIALGRQETQEEWTDFLYNFYYVDRSMSYRIDQWIEGRFAKPSPQKHT
jgi:hypothetical protein